MSQSVSFSGDDEEIGTAIQEAQNRLSEFRHIVEEDARRLIPVYASAMVKVGVESKISGEIEHIWIGGVYFEKDEVGGSVITPPDAIPEIRKGDHIRVNCAKISDWVYYEGDAMIGGFVERVLVRRIQRKS